MRVHERHESSISTVDSRPVRDPEMGLSRHYCERTHSIRSTRLLYCCDAYRYFWYTTQANVLVRSPERTST